MWLRAGAEKGVGSRFREKKAEAASSREVADQACPVEMCDRGPMIIAFQGGTPWLVPCGCRRPVLARLPPAPGSVGEPGAPWRLERFHPRSGGLGEEESAWRGRAADRHGQRPWLLASEGQQEKKGSGVFLAFFNVTARSKRRAGLVVITGGRCRNVPVVGSNRQVISASVCRVACGFAIDHATRERGIGV